MIDASGRQRLAWRKASPRLRLDSATARPSLGFAELWGYRGLLYFLVWRELKVRYKQTVVGVGWAILQPLLYMAVLTVMFGAVAQVPSEGVPYPLFVYAGLLPWTYFASAVGTASTSLVSNSNLLTKIYFPRLLVPLSVILASLVDVLIGLVLLLGLLLFYGFTPTPRLAALLPFAVLAALAALAVSIWFSALDVRYRDVRSTIPFLLQAWMFASPVIYPASLISLRYRGIFGLNPMAGVVEGFRWAIEPNKPFPATLLGVAVGVIALLLASGVRYFRTVEPSFADDI